jgi:hypothetical protein
MNHGNSMMNDEGVHAGLQILHAEQRPFSHKFCLWQSYQVKISIAAIRIKLSLLLPRFTMVATNPSNFTNSPHKSTTPAAAATSQVIAARGATTDPAVIAQYNAINQAAGSKKPSLPTNRLRQEAAAIAQARKDADAKAHEEAVSKGTQAVARKETNAEVNGLQERAQVLDKTNEAAAVVIADNGTGNAERQTGMTSEGPTKTVRRANGLVERYKSLMNMAASSRANPINMGLVRATRPAVDNQSNRDTQKQQDITATAEQGHYELINKKIGKLEQCQITLKTEINTKVNSVMLDELLGPVLLRLDNMENANADCLKTVDDNLTKITADFAEFKEASKTSVDGAMTAAQKSQNDATSAGEKAQKAMEESAGATKTSAGALETAQQAQRDAHIARDASTSAVKQADGAKKVANTAKTIANGAKLVAAEAKESAKQATTMANEASKVIIDAKSTMEATLTTANLMKADATAAQEEYKKATKLAQESQQSHVAAKKEYEDAKAANGTLRDMLGSLTSADSKNILRIASALVEPDISNHLKQLKEIAGAMDATQCMALVQVADAARAISCGKRKRQDDDTPSLLPSLIEQMTVMANSLQKLTEILTEEREMKKAKLV